MIEGDVLVEDDDDVLDDRRGCGRCWRRSGVGERARSFRIIFEASKVGRDAVLLIVRAGSDWICELKLNAR